MDFEKLSIWVPGIYQLYLSYSIHKFAMDSHANNPLSFIGYSTVEYDRLNTIILISLKMLIKRSKYLDISVVLPFLFHN